jgi:hypothetical protein
VFPKISRKAFTGLLVGAVMAVMIGSILLIISYTVIAAVMGTITNTSAGLQGGTALNASYVSNQTNITQALNIIGISLIIVGIAGIIYMLVGLGGSASGRG